MLDDGWLGMFCYGVGPFNSGSVRVLVGSWSSNDSSGGVRVFNQFIDDRVDLACCRFGCGGRSRVMGRLMLVIGGG